MRTLLCSVVLSAALAGALHPDAALADGALPNLLSEADEAALAQFDTRREIAISEARADADEGSDSALSDALAGKTLPFDAGYDPSGDWRCRFFRLGGAPGVRVGDWFACRIFDDGAGWVLRKEAGTLQGSGRLFRLTEERLLYVGDLRDDGAAAETGSLAAGQNRIAVLTRVADGRLRLEFPAASAETAFLILEMSP